MQISCHSTTHIICSQCVFQLLIVLVFSLLYALIFVPWKTEVCHWTWPAGGLDKTLEGGRKRNGFYSPCSFPSGLQFWHQLHPSSFGHSSCAMCPLPWLKFTVKLTLLCPQAQEWYWLFFSVGLQVLFSHCHLSLAAPPSFVNSFKCISLNSPFIKFSSVKSFICATNFGILTYIK